MSLIPTKQIDGDVSIGRNAAIGGKATVRGSVTIGHNLKVEGWLDAPNVKGPNKGMFLTEMKLRESYPLPHDGWWALVGTTLPAPIYIADGGEWVATGESAGNPTLDMQQYNDALEELTSDFNALKNEVTSNENNIELIRNQINSIGTSVQTLTSEVNGLKTRMTDAETNIEGTCNTVQSALQNAANALQAAQSAGTLANTAKDTAESALPPAITLDQLDSMGTDGEPNSIRNLIRNGIHTRYRVVTTGNRPVIVGTLDLLGDSMNHVVTQVFTTHIVHNDDGSFDGSTHQCQNLHIYFRSLNLASPSLDNATGTWSNWKDVALVLAGKPGGLAPLDSNGKIPSNFLPASSGGSSSGTGPGDVSEDIIDRLNALEAAVWPLNVEITATPAVIKANTPTEVHLSWHATRFGENVTALTSFTLNGSTTTNYYSDVSLSLQHGGIRQYGISANFKGVTQTASVVVKATAPTYFGTVSANWNVSEDNVKALEELIIGSRSLTRSGIHTSNGRIVLAFPKNFGTLVSVKDGNDCEVLSSYTMSELTVDNIPYYCYILTTPITATNVTQIFD